MKRKDRIKMLGESLMMPKFLPGDIVFYVNEDVKIRRGVIGKVGVYGCLEFNNMSGSDDMRLPHKEPEYAYTLAEVDDDGRLVKGATFEKIETHIRDTKKGLYEAYLRSNQGHLVKREKELIQVKASIKKIKGAIKQQEKQIAECVLKEDK